jgi:hypothetical protein
VVELTQPAGYLPYLFSMHASAPIPPDGADERLGAAEGHTRDYGRFLVATGPYMFAGSENLDFSLPADEQEPVSGYNPGQSIQFVRNPSYDPATDGLRPAYADGMNISIGGDNNDLYNQVLAGELDMVMDEIVPPQVCGSTRPTRRSSRTCTSTRRTRFGTSRSTWRSRRSTTCTFAGRSTWPSTRRACGRCAAVRRSARSPVTSW